MLKASLRQSLKQSDSFTFQAAKSIRDNGLSVQEALTQAIDSRLSIGKPIPLRARDEALVIESLANSDVFTIESIESFFMGIKGGVIHG